MVFIYFLFLNSGNYTQHVISFLELFQAPEAHSRLDIDPDWTVHQENSHIYPSPLDVHSLRQLSVVIPMNRNSVQRKPDNKYLTSTS